MKQELYLRGGTWCSELCLEYLVGGQPPPHSACRAGCCRRRCPSPCPCCGSRFFHKPGHFLLEPVEILLHQQKSFGIKLFFSSSVSLSSAVSIRSPKCGRQNPLLFQKVRGIPHFSYTGRKKYPDNGRRSDGNGRRHSSRWS